MNRNEVLKRKKKEKVISNEREKLGNGVEDTTSSNRRKLFPILSEKAEVAEVVAKG